MKRQNRWLAVTSVMTLLLLSASAMLAQDNTPPGDRQGDRGDRGGRGRGGFGDPAEWRQRMMDNMREQFGVKEDAEWKILEQRIQKVMDARRDVGFGGSGMSRMFRRPGGDDNRDGGDRRRGFGPEPSAEEQALEKAIDSKASSADLKSAMAKYRTAKKDKDAKLTAAQEDLKKVLDTRQEAIALSMGLIQ